MADILQINFYHASRNGKEVAPSTIPTGEYAGHWYGQYIDIEVDGEEVTLHVDTPRVTKTPVIVIRENGRFKFKRSVDTTKTMVGMSIAQESVEQVATMTFSTDQVAQALAAHFGLRVQEICTPIENSEIEVAFIVEMQPGKRNA